MTSRREFSAAATLAAPAAESVLDPDDGRHDFDFLHGCWRIHNERLRERLVGSSDWEVFQATGECGPVLGGLGNVDSFVTAWGEGFQGMTLRLFDPVAREWSLQWASNREGRLEPPVVGDFVDGVGSFQGDDRHAGRAVRVRFLWNHVSANTAHWQQAFSTDDGASWETNWHMWFRRTGDDGRLLHDDAVVELRQYTLHPGQRDTLIALFEREFIEPQEAVGMHVIGHFRDLDAPDRFVWLRGFPSMAIRRDALEAFYTGIPWRRHRDAANATMIDSDNVLLLKPAMAGAGLPSSPAPRPGLDAATAASSAVCLGMCLLDPPAEQGFAAHFDAALAPLLAQAGGDVIARYVTNASENTFPRLPVREGERVFVWLARFDDVAAMDRHLAALHTSAAWDKAIAEAAREGLRGMPAMLRLAPTERSELR